MEVHLRAKLDQEGRLESVQSCCTQPSPMSSPSFPFAEQNDDKFQQFAKTSTRSEKFVPYVEKKDLVYKLDSKVDEMGNIITQMAELNKRLKIQDKLIAQYEEKLKENKRTIKALEKENQKLRERTGISTLSSTLGSSFKSSTLKSTMLENPRPARRLSWPIDFRLSHYQNQTQSLELNKNMFTATNFYNNKSERSPSENTEDYDSDVVQKASRPSTLSVSVDKSYLCGKDKKEDEHFGMCYREVSVYRGYSYVKNQQQLNTDHSLSFHKPTELENSIDAETNTNNIAFGNVDKDGYLLMTCALGEKLDNHFCLEKEKSVQFNNRQNDEACKACVENEAIHSTWTDVKNGNFLPKQDDTGDELHVKYVDPLNIDHDYVSIPDEHVPDHIDRPPIPNPRISRFPRSTTSDATNVKCARSNTFPNDPNIGPTARDRSSSVPNNSLPLYQPTGHRKDEKERHIVKSKSSCSFEMSHFRRPTPDHVTTKSERRTLGNDMKKDDDLNKVLKDMRTTMEWNKSKKKLISRSHHNTVDTVEMKLRSTVQAVYGTYTTLYSEQGSRSKKFSAEKVLKKIKEKIGKPDIDDLQCDDFLRKCIDLVHQTAHLAKTP